MLQINPNHSLKIQTGEFWTAKQRQSHPIHHTVSYRASFKPELPSFFINRYLSRTGKVVMDPFGGRGTTAIQANLEGHYAIHHDINPLSLFLAGSRQFIPDWSDIERKINQIDFGQKTEEEEGDQGLLHFYHPDTLREIKNLKKIAKEDDSPEMKLIQLAALSRLHGHSPGFFSVYSFPQFSVTPEAQRKNNLKRGIVPEYKQVKGRILYKMKRDLSVSLPPFYHEFSRNNKYLQGSATALHAIETESVDLIVTSPPFLDKVAYVQDNWLRHWFLDITAEETDGVSIFKNVSDWKDFIHHSLQECSRVLKKDAKLVMEVGEVKHGKSIVNLDEVVIQAVKETGLEWYETIVNAQKFTKLSNCWNVENNSKGTNSNRCVVLKKEE